MVNASIANSLPNWRADPVDHSDPARRGGPAGSVRLGRRHVHGSLVHRAGRRRRSPCSVSLHGRRRSRARRLDAWSPTATAAAPTATRRSSATGAGRARSARRAARFQLAAARRLAVLHQRRQHHAVQRHAAPPRVHVPRCAPGDHAARPLPRRLGTGAVWCTETPGSASKSNASAWDSRTRCTGSCRFECRRLCGIASASGSGGAPRRVAAATPGGPVLVGLEGARVVLGGARRVALPAADAAPAGEQSRGRAARRMSNARVVVVALDAASPQLLRALSAAGRMPHLRSHDRRRPERRHPRTGRLLHRLHLAIVLHRNPSRPARLPLPDHLIPVRIAEAGRGGLARPGVAVLETSERRWSPCRGARRSVDAARSAAQRCPVVEWGVHDDLYGFGATPAGLSSGSSTVTDGIRSAAHATATAPRPPTTTTSHAS